MLLLYFQNRLCVASRNRKYLQVVTKAVEEIIHKENLNIEVCQTQILWSPNESCGNLLKLFNN